MSGAALQMMKHAELDPNKKPKVPTKDDIANVKEQLNANRDALGDKQAQLNALLADGGE